MSFCVAASAAFNNVILCAVDCSEVVPQWYSWDSVIFCAVDCSEVVPQWYSWDNVIFCAVDCSQVVPQWLSISIALSIRSVYL